jgi:hypothetical protein
MSSVLSDIRPLAKCGKGLFYAVFTSDIRRAGMSTIVDCRIPGRPFVTEKVIENFQTQFNSIFPKIGRSANNREAPNSHTGSSATFWIQLS